MSTIGITADIAQAYLQIAVASSDRDYLCFLWYDDVTKDDPEIVKYRFTRVIFGASPLQLLLNGVIKLHVEKYKEIDPVFPIKILRSFYIDDLNTSVENYEEGLKLYKKTKLRFF